MRLHFRMEVDRSALDRLCFLFYVAGIAFVLLTMLCFPFLDGAYR